MRRAHFGRSALTACVLAALWGPISARGDVPPPTTGPAAKPILQTLASALAQSVPPTEVLMLAVGADQVPPPPDTALPPAGAPALQVADAYGRLLHAFPTVTAVAPPTMTLLNTDPGTPNPYDGIPHDDAFRLLLGSLDDGQWRALTSERGLGLSDLGEERQRGLFLSLFPDGLTLHPGTNWGRSDDAGEPLKLTAQDVTLVRLRVAQRIMIGLPMTSRDNGWLNSPNILPGGKPQYEVWGGEDNRARDTLYGVAVRATVPNAPKPSDLDWDAPALKRTVSVGGVKTVADLIARIGQIAQIEIYADRRFEGRAVTLLGPAQGRARDLLQALALCVAGTYRRVGPAYVLTNDRLGLGSRRMILSRFAQEADVARQAVISEAGDHLITARGSVNDLPMLSNDIAFSDAQKAQITQSNTQPMPGRGMELQVPLAQLTPTQQDTARRNVAQWNQQQDANSNGGGNDRVTLDGKLLMMAQPTILLQSPSFPGAAVLDNYINAWNLFQPSDKLMQEYWRKQQEQQQKQTATPAASPTPPPPPLPALASVLAPIPRRAVIARPWTAKEVDALILALQAAKMNQLWLDVFSDGEDHLHSASGDAGPDILTEALAKTKGTGITVVPTLDLLNWGKGAPRDARDLTMLGETSAQAQTYRRRYELMMYSGLSADAAEKQATSTEFDVSPVAAAIRQRLLALVQRLASTPGVQSLALRGTVTPGYDRTADSRYGVSGDTLGYTPELRLAFLRRAHVDPIDLDAESSSGKKSADTSLPEFDDWTALQSASKDWNDFRAGANRDLLTQILTSARSAAGRRVPLWIKQRRSDSQKNWYGAWEDSRSPLPALSEDLAYGGSITDAKYSAFAHTQCRVNVLQMDQWQAQSAQGLTMALQQMKPGWDGIVLDWSDQTGDALLTLARNMSPSLPPDTPPSDKAAANVTSSKVSKP